MRLAAALTLALLGVAQAGGGARTPTVLTLSGPACSPNPGRVVIGVQSDAAATRQMTEIVTADQAARSPGVGGIDWDTVAREDRERRNQTLALLRAGRLGSGADLFAAALVFQHGDCPQHYELANRLSAAALARGDDRARWLYAATYDRWQRALGRPQKYGTQYVSMGVPCAFRLEPVDPATTDAQRAEYDVPSLAEALARADQINVECEQRR